MNRCAVFLTAVLLLAAAAAGAAAEYASPRPRIISLYAAHTEVLLRLGARDHIIGVSRQETYDGPETEGWHPEEFSARDDAEKFLAARPDLILARPQHIAGNTRLKTALERAGIEVRAVQVTRASELYEYWRTLGGLVGREREAEAMAAEFEAAAERYRAAAARLERRPGVFIEAMHREVKTFTPDSLPAWLTELAGGVWVAADAAPVTPGVIIADYGPERLLSRADDVDIFIAQNGIMNRVTAGDLRDRKIYRPLRAFRTGQVHLMPESLLARPTPSLLQGLEMLAVWTGLETDG